MSPSSKIIPMTIGAVAGMATVAVALPASTPPVRRDHAYCRPGGIARLQKLTLGGAEQWILIRSEHVDNPILLFLHGGPGISQLGLNRRCTAALERFFTVVNWDQRGAGKSHCAGRDASKMTIDQLIEDTRQLVLYLLQQFGQSRIVLAGRSWGSALGMLCVSKFPELFHAYVGIGQISDMQESELASYQWTVAQAIRRNDPKALRKLEQMGPPPYRGDWLSSFTTQRKYVCRYGGEISGSTTGANGLIAGNVLLSPEYSFLDRVFYSSAAKRSLRLLHPQLMEVDLFRSVPELHVPVFLVEGRYDRVVPVSVARRYYDALRAPRKDWTWFERSAHMPEVEEREKFCSLILQKVLPIASAG